MSLIAMSPDANLPDLFAPADGYSQTDPTSSHHHPILRNDKTRASIVRAIICVPAKNEAARLPEFFEAMGLAVAGAISAGIDCDVVVVLDGCSDVSHAIIAALSLNFLCPIHPITLADFGEPHAGRARKAAMDGALALIPLHDRATTAILTTDADTRVDLNWITASARALHCTDLVAGWVDWDEEEPIADLIAQEDYFSELHRHRRRIDPVAFDSHDPHHKMYGASLGIRADAYVAVGGLPERRSSEDVALTRAVRLSGLRMRQDRDVRVTTSTRRNGRAKGGFSDAILSDAHRRKCGGVDESGRSALLNKVLPGECSSS